VTDEFLHSDLKPILTGKQTEIECPLCHQGHIRFFDKVANCGNEGCNFHIFRTILGKKLTNSELTDLIIKGQTRELSGFKCKDGKPFKAKLKRDDKGGIAFVFSQKKSNN
jgi:DNA topoisomerase-3